MYPEKLNPYLNKDLRTYNDFNLYEPDGPLFEVKSLNIYQSAEKTKIKTFMKANLEKSDDQTNIDKFNRVAENITEYHTIRFCTRM